MIGQAEVTATVGSESLSVTAKGDGSFAIPIEASSGEEIDLTAEDGLNSSLTVP